MMESTSTTNDATSTGESKQTGPPAGQSAQKILKETADDLTKRISDTDITRINGYMRLANLVAALLLIATCVVRLFLAPSYSHFLVIIYIIMMAGGLVFIENHERFPSQAEKVKANFGFMFTAFGKAAYIFSIAFLAFSQGWIGAILGVFLLLLAAFNFFLIYRHPAYKQEMTKSNTNADANDLEEMPELRYNKPVTNDAGAMEEGQASNPPTHVAV